MVRLSCELPYAVGVRKNTAESITLCQRKQSKRQTISGVLSRACSSIFCPHQTCLILLCSLPMLPQVGLEPTTLRLTEEPRRATTHYYSLLSTTGSLGYLARGVVHLSLVALHVIQWFSVCPPSNRLAQIAAQKKWDQKYPPCREFDLLLCESRSARPIRESKNKKGSWFSPIASLKTCLPCRDFGAKSQTTNKVAGEYDPAPFGSHFRRIKKGQTSHGS